MCDFNLYLLEFDNANSQYIDYNPAVESNRLTTCVKHCEDVGVNYVSNPNNGRCEYCGPFCTHCTLQYGCSDCYGPNGPMDSAAWAYADVSGIGKIDFPYSYHENTAYGGPSSEFRVCIECEKYDERCDRCLDPLLREEEGKCESCHDYVQPRSL